MRKFDLRSLVRSNIWELKPYSSARDEFWGDEGIFLDANENPFGNKNRYPDPHQRTLKKSLSKIKGISVDNICIGNGSDEIIDLVFRIFCEPQKDSVIICPPTYGMYEVSANINNVNIIKIPLDSNFELNVDEILSQNAKCLFLCSPNNPTGNSLKNIEVLMNEFNGIIIVDEAYIDFSDKPSFIGRLSEFPNLIIMQTFSKAWALASARVGIAYADSNIIKLMDKTKPPYNVSRFNQEVALKALSKPKKFERRLKVILEQRDNLLKEFTKISVIKKVFPTDANFILIKVSDADKLYNYLVSNKLIVRNRNSVISDCIRITVGTPKENEALIEALKNYTEG
ncbi:MAG TPA: histidinol-phosphate transaminase [Fermentimonas caenicola]|jgi:histidinol-phosphate aminotransferase|uniref:histidinol-phosphate transaminase n=1 Tax=Lascolabacillus sp. TaxID=1924068 RepID=UPI000AC218DC|nr:histidinol-phosphate transaminase [Lascolabacillus sp.]MBP6174629.1 histidinol-phosphate transaminase [Fermentimonas sp.]MDI9626801.1 histidinol-phosphate transaminase [Bacteroidota bacterium]TAH61259.1 MAG: histidinol-phosphate transaminase [Fermentimonas caenicola]MBP6196861.1 histidinol-phosphate transaminase [Fermentimonas sp.]MBP7104371.1 histidinol-phosphate transaminase [Fermentimonas sp.]